MNHMHANKVKNIRSGKKKRQKMRLNKIGTQVFLTLLAILWLIPIINSFRLSLDSSGWDNYKTVLGFRLSGMYYLPRMFFNSVLVVTVSVTIILTVSILGSYAFSKMTFRGRQSIYLFILACFAIPLVSTFIPNMVIIKSLHLRDTYLAIILPMAAINTPLAILIIKNYFDNIPNDYLEAANIDGCKPLRALIYVLLPISKPVIVNVLVVVFLYTWNDYTTPLIFTNKQELFTLTLAPGFFNLAKNRIEIGPLYACIILISIPVIGFYLAMQNKIIAGITSGGIKG